MSARPLFAHFVPWKGHPGAVRVVLREHAPRKRKPQRALVRYLLAVREAAAAVYVPRAI